MELIHTVPNRRTRRAGARFLVLRVRRLGLRLTLAAALLASVSPAAMAAGRQALLIGNAGYSALPPLDNPTYDARLLGETLERRGFNVRIVLDADYDGMRSAIDGFRRDARDAEVALVYYAGHGVQVDGTNYLLPVDAEVYGREDLRREGLVLALLLHDLEAASPNFGILILDACRNNPLAELEVALAEETGRSLAPREGLAPASPATGLLIAYATAPGQVALDGPSGSNSPYAEALAYYLDEPGLEIGLLFRKVSARVRQATAGAQVPWTEASLTGDTLVLNPAPEVSEPLVAEAAPAEDAIAALNRALDLDDPLKQRLALVRFAREHGDSPLAQLAQAYVARLEQTRREPRIELASLETSMVDQQRVEIVAGSAAESLAADAYASLHAPPATPAATQPQTPAAAEPPAAAAVTETATPPADETSAESSAGTAAPEAAPATETAGAAPPADAASLLWPMVAAVDRPDYYERFLDLFPNTAHAASAAAGIELAALAAAPALPLSRDSSRTVEPQVPLMPVVVGAGPVAVPLPTPGAHVVLREPPRHGRLRALDAEGDELALGDVPIAPAKLYYSPPLVMRKGVDQAVLAVVEPPVQEPSPDELAQDKPAPDVPAPEGAATAEAAAETAAETAAEPSEEVAATENEPAEMADQAAAETALAGAADDTPAAAADSAEVETASETVPLETLGAESTATMDEGEPWTVRFEITVDDCDLLAGARFDRQGVVLGLFDNEIEPAQAIPACEAAVAAYPDVPRFRYQLGRALEAAGEGARAAKEYEAAGIAGHEIAIYRLGYLYLIGEGVPVDTDKALVFFEQAAAQGEPYAMNNLGRAYRDGEIVEADREKAIDWFLDAAAQGHTFAYNNLGYMLAEEGDHERALPLFRASAEAGDIYGYNNMGYAYEKGVGVEPDIDEAIAWYEKAAEGGQPNAPINLGLIYLEGRPGLEPDMKRAAFWFAQAAEGGNPWGSVHLASLYARGAVGDAPDPVLAAKVLARAAAKDALSGREAAAQNYGGAGQAAVARFAELPARAVVSAVQAELNRLGYDAGPVDGIPGRRTEAAISAFTSDQQPPLDPAITPIHLLGELLAAGQG